MKMIKEFYVYLLFLGGLTLASSCTMVSAGSGNGGMAGSTSGMPNMPYNIYYNTITNRSFMPATNIIKAGSTVSWLNADVFNHTVTSTTGQFFKSDTIAPEGTFSAVFSLPGTNYYMCMIHPYMMGVIIVTQ